MLDFWCKVCYNRYSEREVINQMGKHNFIYLGTERGKRVVHKVGKTTQTCWARCHSADYLIGIGIDIVFPMGEPKAKLLSQTERMIINYFASMFPIEKGNEYFRCSKHKWERIKPLFLNKMIEYLDEQGYVYTIHEGWCTANSY